MGAKKQAAPAPETPPPPPRPELDVDGIRDSEAAMNAQRNADRASALSADQDSKNKGKSRKLGAAQTASAGLSIG